MKTDEEPDVPYFDGRTTSISDSEVKTSAKTDFEDNGFTTDGDLNRHSPLKNKRNSPFGRRELEKKHFDMINERIVDDVTLDFLYKPHSVTVLVAIAAFLVYKAAWQGSVNSSEQNYFDGFIGAVALFLIIGALTFPNGPFIRPHPIIWRLIFGLSVAYVILLQFALFQSHEDLKKMLTWLDPVGLGQQKLREKNYAVGCWNLTWANFQENIDYFAFAHFTGWVMKTLLLRHWILCWYISIIWEITEIMFMNMLPNFAECWWDSLILDVLICNGLGIYVGMKLSQFLQMRQYHWESIRNIKSRKGKMKRFALQFTPASWNTLDWWSTFYNKGMSNSLRRTGLLTIFVAVWMIAELNTFFIKHIFAIDTQHPVVFWRIILIAVIAAPSIRQFYVFMTDPLTKRVGMQAWIFVLISILEVAICVKSGHAVFSKMEMWSIAVWFFLMIIGTVFCILASTWYAEMFGKTAQIIIRGRRRLCYLESSHENLGILEDDVKKRRSEYLGTQQQ
ncbi:unnamed protein product [Caenorhabditis angaria]|uniref:Phosphatidylserine synthase n=1 Tax=Caenorhabditis angaria TaxID=860376 RepID=A0A9P1MY07_9PELO|nr:unnamed protein product [Caenorhabditis angaria]